MNFRPFGFRIPFVIRHSSFVIRICLPASLAPIGGEGRGEGATVRDGLRRPLPLPTLALSPFPLLPSVKLSKTAGLKSEQKATERTENQSKVPQRPLVGRASSRAGSSGASPHREEKSCRRRRQEA